MIDLHTHTFLSDGELGPAELVRRAENAGYRAIGISDHATHPTWTTSSPRWCALPARRSLS